MDSKYIFPAILIVLQLGASAVCAFRKDGWMAAYWAGAALVNFAVIMKK